MRPNDCSNLEKDKAFKKGYISGLPWWKNTSLIAPVVLMFAGLVGIVYLLNNDMLLTWYIAPYLLLFAIGTMIFKALKRHIQNEMMAVPDSFLVCLARSVEGKNGLVYFAFMKGGHRHNLHQIKNVAKDTLLDEFLSASTADFTKANMLLENYESGSEIYIRAYSEKELNKSNPAWRGEDCIPLLYINDKHTFVIKKKDLTRAKA